MPPTDAVLRAYLRGALPAGQADAIAAWLGTLSEAEAGRILAAAEGEAGLLGTADNDHARGFASDAPRTRLEVGDPLGSGGMAVVHAARDRVLDRTVALKVLLPRRPDEDLDRFLLREAAFRREAAITAGLEHPAIVPVHDVGRLDGLPAFAMKRIEGRNLEAVVQSQALSPTDLMPLLLRVAEAIGYAHNHGIVHRDLTPANVIIGDFGAVHVLDWGVAEHIGQGAVRAGTPDWMPPEQAAGTPADPRMDVYALGRLLRFAWKDAPPPALAALIARCLDADPTRRPAHGGIVADELRRWLDQGLTLAQDAGPLTLAWLRLRRSPRARTGIAVGLVAAAGMACGWWWLTWQEQNRAATRLDAIASTVALDRPEAVELALAEVRTIRAVHPRLTAAAQLEARLATALEVARNLARTTAVNGHLDALLARTRSLGPWADQVDRWHAVMQEAGLHLDGGSSDAEHLRSSPIATALASGLAFQWRAERERGVEPDATTTARLLAAGGSSPGWQALGRLLERTVFRAHDPVFCLCSDSQEVLTDPASAAAALALFGPERRLEAYARTRLAVAPGEFWPLIAVARAALAARDDQGAERLALIASGAEPGSLLPHALLAYVRLQRCDWPGLLAEADRGLAIDVRNVELRTLRAVGLARTGSHDEAQRLAAELPASHLRFHLVNRVGHPMELAVDALIAADIHLPEAAPDLGPLSPHRHH